MSRRNLVPILACLGCVAAAGAAVDSARTSEATARMVMEIEEMHREQHGLRTAKFRWRTRDGIEVEFSVPQQHGEDAEAYRARRRFEIEKAIETWKPEKPS